MALADTDRFRRDLQELVVGDELHRIFEREDDWRRKKDRLVLAGGADIGELLGLDRIHDEVVVTAVDADHHALVDALSRAHEHAAALLQLPERIRDRLAAFGGDQNAIAPVRYVAFDRRVTVEHVREQPRAAGDIHELALKADQSARRDAVIETRTTAAVGFHVRQIATARSERLHYCALMRVLDVDRQLLERLVTLTAAVAVDHAGSRHCEVVAFAAHVFEQDGEMQLAAAVDREHVGVGGIFDPERNVGHDLARQPLAQIAAGDIFAVATGER